LKAHFVLATGNPDKRAEIAAILAGVLGPGVVLEAVDTGAEETGTTLEENARIKAVAACSATGRAAIADDTGLEVDALGGAPGVHSARFAGPGASYAANVAKLLRELDGVEPARRRARFATVALARYPDGREIVARGVVEGAITTEARGVGGFGYDPVFAPDEGGGRTFAEMSAADKHRISHRGRAFRALAAAVAEDRAARMRTL
jgi:XTP/dITP diphosphohydrolase